MASTYSDLKVELIGTGDQTGTWGTTTNNNFSVALGEAITGSADVSFSSADVTVTLTDTNAAQTARNLRLNLTGTSGGARNLILGSGCQIEKLYLINNGLADAVTVKNTTGTGIVVPAGSSMFVYNNGTNVVEALKAIPVGAGGTGLSTLTANNVILGNGTSAVQFVAPGTTGNVLTSNGTTWASAAAVAGGISYTAVKTSNYTAANNEGVLTNTTGGAFTVTLPTSPAVGNVIVVVDSFSQWGTNNLTIDPTASIKIAGNTAGDTLACDINGATVTLVYTGASYGWNVAAQVGGNGGTVVTETGTQTLTNKTISGASNTLTVDGTNPVGFRNVPNSGAKTTSYTLVASDVGKFIELGTGGSVVVPASIFAAGDVISIFNNTSGSISCTCSAITDFYKGGTDTDISSFSVTTRGVATILFITATRAVVTGNLA